MTFFFLLITPNSNKKKKTEQEKNVSPTIVAVYRQFLLFSVLKVGCKGYLLSFFVYKFLFIEFEPLILIIKSKISGNTFAIHQLGRKE